ncbi:hypothetical protein SP5_077_00020 [Sphingomonas parapaucimobilis NBRC 15100]|uniref:Uncharacterized protein n=1 Tax=Sphingomonas parapaucimobilis NBRC 15100 TaxID=1219049 RepID=A0A0A1WBL8_9SPHN|nr:hypothetical protein SP5_077_00020 [Sphingomonas parapaucimobilis NBRC 15100]
MSINGDHPRGCGGTEQMTEDDWIFQGPSPRVRGNHAVSPKSESLLGTIPAGAGEPSNAEASATGPTDHPRGCGGTGVAIS